MAIFGVGAYYGEDVSQKFIDASIVGLGWNEGEAPDLHQIMRSIKPGDIVYIKAAQPGAPLTIKAIGMVLDDSVVTSLESHQLVSFGRRVKWISTDAFVISLEHGKNNVRFNTLYEEFHPGVQKEIIRRVLG
ncbi:hypothetical protein [Marinimicrobium sp. ABcell2]|uniref:hypothetical protein n=1 Tax=Marinimicrobium sp. ABcell2 TaxID=3069751 RepID=UPI0027B84137|nr:hypothetical protein [Marinimicrobium sp. ABcell2]MDQ2076380.1 hypothetical protein [Marinimicrobium sp. ABcell2]